MTSRPSPFLHVNEGRIHDAATGRTLVAGDALHAALARTLGGEAAGAAEAEAEAEAAALESGGWLLDDAGVAAAARRAHLRVVSLETMAACNQRCYFCPVSIAPRPDASMPDALFARIVAQLAAHRATLEAVFLQSYNEPTLDRRFVDQCRALFAAGLPVAILTNASGLTPERSDALLASGRLRYLGVNLSTLDPGRYARDRGHDHLPQVLRNLDHVRDRPLADEMRIIVLGQGDETHDRDVAAIRARFAGSRFDVRQDRVMDRAGYLDVGLRPPAPRPLGGCDNLGSRPFQHLHITPEGRCVLCCQDYDERHVVGDLRVETVDEVLAGEALATLRRWVYGVDEAPDDFICRRCVFARPRAG